MVLKKYLKSIIGAFAIIVCSMLLVALLHYFGIINNLFVNLFKLITVFAALFYSGFIMGKYSTKRGYLAGIIAGAIIDLILIIYGIIVKNSVSFKLILFYIILLAISTIGGMVGIGKSSLTDQKK